MLIPLSTDTRMRHLPFANGLIIVVTIAIYLAIGPAGNPAARPFVHEPGSMSGLFGHPLMHADWMHLGGNMVFLWVFGNAVCARIGNFWYPLVYWGLGVIAATMAMLADPRPGVGASGAIFGLVGMFIVLFPLSRLKMIWTAAYITGGTVKVPSLVMVLFWFLYNAAGAMTFQRNSSYVCHLAGLVGGVLLAGAVLRAGWVRLYRTEKSLPEILRLGWPTPDQKDPVPELDFPPEKLNPLYTPPPKDVATYARGSEEAERTYEPLLEEGPVPSPPQLRTDGPSRFERWRPAGDNIYLRCLCGASLSALPEKGGATILCPRCGREVAVPARKSDDAKA